MSLNNVVDIKFLAEWLNAKSHIDGSNICFFCEKETERTTMLSSSAGIHSVYECKDCRQDRVREQVRKGLRPASDLEEENFPENRRGW